METTSKTPVNIVQELIAMHSTRKEAYEKIQAKEVDADLKGKLAGCISQSDKFTAELLSELSQFGDGVSGEVDRDTEFFNTWKNSVGNLDNMNTQDFSETFQQLETILKNNYQDFIDSQVDGTGPLLDILNKQVQALAA